MRFFLREEYEHTNEPMSVQAIPLWFLIMEMCYDAQFLWEKSIIKMLSIATKKI